MTMPRHPAPDRARRATQGITLRYALEEPSARVTRLAWSPDGRSLAVPTRDGLVRLYDAMSGRVRLTLPNAPGPVMGVAWSPDGRRLAGVVNGCGTLLWDANDGRLLARDEHSAHTVTGIAWSPCGTRLAVSAEEDDGAVHLFDATGPTLRLTATLESPGALHVAWNAAGTNLAVGSRDGAVHRWHAWDKRILDTDRGHDDAAVHVAWAPSTTEAVLASASKDGTIRLRNAAAGGPCRVLTAHRDQVVAVAFAPSGELFASKSRDGTVLLWRTGLWQPVACITEPTADTGWSVGLAFHPGGHLLATLGEHDTIVRVWEIDGGALPMVPVGAETREAMAAPPLRMRPGTMSQRVRLR